LLDAKSLVVVSAAQVIPAVRAHQLALVPRQTMRTVGTNLAMMINRRVVRFNRTNVSVPREIRGNFIIEDTGPLGKHGSEISMVKMVAAMLDRGRHSKYPNCNAV
jgi:hypothetical protein